MLQVGELISRSIDRCCRSVNFQSKFIFHFLENRLKKYNIYKEKRYFIKQNACISLKILMYRSIRQQSRLLYSIEVLLKQQHR